MHDSSTSDADTLSCLEVRKGVFEPTADGLGVASLRVVEPIRPLLHLHPPAWADPESARRRRSPLPKSLLTVDADRQTDRLEEPE